MIKFGGLKCLTTKIWGAKCLRHYGLFSENLGAKADPVPIDVLLSPIAVK